MLAQLERTDEAQISLTDPDSRAMAAHTKAGVGYNIQVAVDAKHKLIVEQAVTNQVVDIGLLAQTAVPPARFWTSRRSTSSPIAATSNRGHRGLREGRLHPARSQTATPLLGREGFFRKDEFRYDSGRDAYVCPAGKVLTPIRHVESCNADETDEPEADQSEDDKR